MFAEGGDRGHGSPLTGHPHFRHLLITTQTLNEALVGGQARGILLCGSSG